MKPLSGRVGLFTDSVIRRMTRISDEYDAINLSQGFPDFDPPRELMDALTGRSPTMRRNLTRWFSPTRRLSISRRAVSTRSL